MTGTPVMHNLRDFRPDLHAAIGYLHGAGFDGEAYVIAAALQGAYGTALEMVQAIRAAVLRVEHARGAELPGEVTAAFGRALAEVARVVAALTPLNAAPASVPRATGQPELSPCSSS